MKTTNNYEAPVAEMIEMNMPVVLMASGDGGQIVPPTPNPGTIPGVNP
jgi:hypothetical protein